MLILTDLTVELGYFHRPDKPQTTIVSEVRVILRDGDWPARFETLWTSQTAIIPTLHIGHLAWF